MDWFDRLKESLFGEATQRGGQLHHGPLKRSPAFMQRHLRWLDSKERRDLMEHFQEQLEKERITADTELHLFTSPQATGIHITRPPSATPEVLHHLMEEFKDRIIAEGYRLHLSDHRIDVKGEHRERYYLKPVMDPDHQGPPLPQRYGNIAIESRGNDELKAMHLKLLITVYSDRLYMPAQSATSLINSLFTGRGRDRR